MLIVLYDSDSAPQPLASDLLDKVYSLAFYGPISHPTLQHIRTSHLPLLILDEWLSDDHINACVDLINHHPERALGTHALNTHFMDYMRRRFERSVAYPASRLTKLDQLVINSTVTKIFIPLHLPSHWVLLCVDITSCCYSFTDTLDLAEVSAPAGTISLLNRWLSTLLGEPVFLAPIARTFGVGPQFDSSSCAVAVMSSMAHCALGRPYSIWTQSTTSHHRLTWALCFLTTPNNPVLPVFETYLEDLDTNSKDFASSVPVDSPICVSTTSSPLELTPACSPASLSKARPVLRQTTLPFKSIPYDEWRIQEKRRGAVRIEERKLEAARFDRMQAHVKAEKRKSERNRKRASRARKKAAQKAIEAAKKLKVDSQHIVQVAPATLDARHNISLLSRPYSTTNAPVTCNSTKPSTKVTPTQPTRRINWCQNIYWNLIESAACAVGYPWSPTDIVKRLCLIDHDMFQFLRPQRISQWRDHRYPNELRWTEAHLRAIKAGARPTGGPGCHSVFHDQPEVVKLIKNGLLAFRKTGHYIPDAFSLQVRSGRLFRCSERFVRRFLREELGWSVRKATRAAQKYPSNVCTVLLNAFLRILCAIHDHVIPASCIVNVDQTQVIYSSGDQKTWTTSGERQVNILGAEEKRAFTLMVGVSGSGSLLPFQAIYAGKSSRSVPDSSAPGYSEAKQLGFLLEYSNTTTYWSTFDTMCNWVSQILAPYFRTQIQQNQLPAEQRCILQLDCWSVHRSAQFRSWMQDHYPWIIFDYVPGGCTGLFQACDVGIQRVLKLAIRNSAHADVVAETVNALRFGIEPQYVLNDQSLPTLRRRSLNWIVQAYRAVNRPELIKKAFSLCAVPDSPFNLSYESLVSIPARQAIMEVFNTNPAQYRELILNSAPILVANLPEDDIDLAVADIAEDDDLNPSVDEVLNLIMNAQTVQDVARPVAGVDELESGGDGSDEPTSPPAAVATLQRARRVTRPPARYSGAEWVVS
ncbi:Ulp1 protease family, carboxy-terminal catalytic domain protein [Ceratobasidium sp. AG-Ba]|nr:Ulp1 protease family, carboxy-terminal catalytic domain protein [Ceratobasidium sp. AG-Ba]